MIDKSELFREVFNKSTRGGLLTNEVVEYKKIERVFRFSIR